jgi:hypothetical protein
VEISLPVTRLSDAKAENPTVRLAPAGREPRDQLTIRPAEQPLEHSPPSLTWTLVVPSGVTECMETLFTVVAPRLVAVRRNVTSPPGFTGFGDAATASLRSAAAGDAQKIAKAPPSPATAAHVVVFGLICLVPFSTAKWI